MNISKKYRVFSTSTKVKYFQVQTYEYFLIQIIYFIVTNVSRETPYNYAVNQNKLCRILLRITNDNRGILHILYLQKNQSAFK
jgi:hypothetical protein